MSDTKVGDHLYRRSIMRDFNGNIISMLDEADGGWIVKNRNVVNNEKWQRYLQIEQDKRDAASAVLLPLKEREADEAIIPPEIARPDTKISDLEKRVDTMDSKLDAILQAIKKE